MYSDVRTDWHARKNDAGTPLPWPLHGVRKMAMHSLGYSTKWANGWALLHASRDSDININHNIVPRLGYNTDDLNVQTRHVRWQKDVRERGTHARWGARPSGLSKHKNFATSYSQPTLTATVDVSPVSEKKGTRRTHGRR